ncbi:MAG: M12 family metallo-peptidase [Planctomycetota bacterium]
MRRTIPSLVLLSCAPVVCAQAPPLFINDGGDARLALHPFEIPTLERVAFELPTGPVEVDLRLVARRGPASYSLAGTHPEMPTLHAMVTVEGPVVSALLTDPALGTHRFEHTDAGSGALTPIASPDVPLCGCAGCTHGASSEPADVVHADGAVRTGTARVAAADPVSAGSLEACVDALDQIDVLVLYTQKAIDLAGGDEMLVRASVQMGVDEFNLACQNATVSGTAPSARLVHAAFTTYPESTTSSSVHLNNLRDMGDGELDEAHTLREEHRADVVILVGGAMDVCGRAFIGVLPGNTPRPDLAFGVVNYNCTNAPTYAFAHELGHILGALHNIEADYCDTGAREFAHAFVAPDEAYATIMSSGTSAPRIPYFSDADADFMGMPVGDSVVANNAGSFRQGAATAVAGYRLSDCNQNGICDSSEIAAGMLDDLDANSVADACQPDEDANGIADGVEITLDPSLDLDADGMLDSVELPVRYVDASASGLGTGLSWGDAHTDLREALGAATRSGGDIREVWVASGTYYPTGSSLERAADFVVPSDVTLIGSFAGTESSPDERDIASNPTVLSGDLMRDDLPDSLDNHTDNAFTIMRFSRARGVVVDGFTFTGGYGDTNSNCGFYNFGGGVFAFFSEYELRNCTFVRNAANNGGALASTDGSTARVIGCGFVGNELVTVDFLAASGEIFPRTGVAAGAYMTSAPAPENDAYIEGCRFIGNSGDGALVNLGGSPTIVNSLFTGNSSPFSGAIENSSTQGSDATIINCTVVDNVVTSSNEGAGIGNFRSDVTIINSIVRGNVGASGVPWEFTQVGRSASTALLRNVNLEGSTGMLNGFTYENVVDVDPLFVDASGMDFALAPGSPMIDAGDTSAFDALAVTTDLAGGDRFVDDPGAVDTGVPSVVEPARAIVDIGAFERQGGASTACVGDFDGDGDVDLGDFGVFGAAFGTSVGDPDYDAQADVDSDGDVDLGDFGVFGAEFGRFDC